MAYTWPPPQNDEKTTRTAADNRHEISMNRMSDEKMSEHVLGFGDLRTCFPGLSPRCIEELADACAVRIRAEEFGAFDFEVNPAGKAIITKHESAAWLHEHLREACRLAMSIPV